MKEKDLKSVSGSERNLVALCLASFTMSVASGIYLVALPFMLKRLGGTDGDAGLGMALNFGAYLLSCLATARLLDRFNAKRLVQCGAMGILIAYAGAAFTTHSGRTGAGAIWMLNFFSALAGMLTAIFWPPMMGWISTGFEKEALSRRLGSFNMSWSSGSWVSPYLGGLLIAASSTWPMVTASAAVVISFLFIRFARNPRRDGATGLPGPDTSAADLLHPHLVQFQWMARVALVTAFVCAGLLRSQLGLLLRFDLGYSEATYGIAMTIMCGANFLVFTAAARAHKWHYVLWLFQSSQLIMAAAMLLPVRYSQQWILLAAAGIVGTSQAFIYVSHLFYGVSGGRRRLGLMAVHEFLLSGGIVMGSVAGGYISDSFGRRAPYLFGTAAVVVGLLIQAAIRARLGTRQAR